MNVSLTPELEKFVDGKVASGSYKNASAVIREGLRLLKERDDVRRTWTEQVERGWKQYQAGECLDGETAMAAVRSRVQTNFGSSADPHTNEQAGVRHEYLLTPEAQTNIDAIVDVVAEDSADAALRVVDAFKHAFEHLAGTPRIGHQREDVTERPLRFLGVLSYLVGYDPSSSPLTVIAVLYATRDAEQVIKEI